MKAIIFASDGRDELAPLTAIKPSPLLKVAGKRIIFHVLDFLVRNNIKKIALVISLMPHEIENKIMEGGRWGISVDYFLVRHPDYPFGILAPAIHSWEEAQVLIGMGNSLPNIDKELLSASDCLFFYEDGKWSGWGIMSTRKLAKIPYDWPYNRLPELFPECRKCIVEPLISTSNFESFLESQFRALKYGEKKLLFSSSSREIEPGIWLSRGTVIHPTAKIIPPVFIGYDCQLFERVEIGPNAILESNSVIDKNTKVKESLICKLSYVGRHLEVERSIIDRNILINTKYGTVVNLKDDFILGELPARVGVFPFYNLLERFVALIFLILFFPAYIYLLMVETPEVKEVVVIPGNPTKKPYLLTKWIRFSYGRYFRSYPLIFKIFTGKVHLIGVNPRTPEEVDMMPSEWKKLYFHSKLGLITLADLDYGIEKGVLNERYTSEAFYSANQSFGLDVKLFWRWLRKKIKYAGL